MGPHRANLTLAHSADREPALVNAPVAIIDIGSNSVRLVAYDGLSRAPTPLYNEKVLCGLGRNVLTTGRLNDEAVRRALAALARFRVLCETMRVSRLFVLATAAARDASNGPAFLEAAEAACGTRIELLSGRREAELSALGVVSGFHAPDGVVGDLGGGSLELVDVRGAVVGQGVTMPLGGLALQDLSGGSLKKAGKIVREHMKKAAPQLETLRGRTFYAVGGTWRALARLHQAARQYPVHVMHGYSVEPTDELSFLQVVEQSDAATLQDVEAISEARRPLLAYGAVVLEEIIRVGRPREVAISASGVREGLLYEQVDRETRALDPLLASCAELNQLRARSPRHADELIAWTDRFVAALDGPETADERRLRHAACLLSDIGWRAHPDYRGEQSIAIIQNAAFVGIDHPGRGFLALAIYFRHEGVAPEKANPMLRALAGPRLFERARLIGALLRVAFPMTAGMEGALRRMPLSIEDGRVVLSLPPEWDALNGDRLLNRVRGLARIAGLEGRVRVG
ncbi:exopolyphosphatase [Methylobacterium sp. E-041]|uniref:exopolyphosphatase n=1 Tax=unclassified Methylobacterium TaxID=2615210 RepID=UPI0011CA497E|nr:MULTISPECIES: exopolyphosphatase [unclassified Methylobacterium]TXM93869.1 exopolyphosphatase [Methylobacterium sp. WL116]MCJ2005673.1 exopolyphosphatase [Methylobacterium sp. J-092]MCJ2042837.1 exopolyphosphatase [Methylobacterium sp. J-059]MCJ2077197.1 exopolyphosphatase [Methylobacterium sp. E-016]MCJ2107594.1 exopolyphosphatase [Methylobacterium sp. E-041]